MGIPLSALIHRYILNIFQMKSTMYLTVTIEEGNCDIARDDMCHCVRNVSLNDPRDRADRCVRSYASNACVQPCIHTVDSKNYDNFLRFAVLYLWCHIDQFGQSLQSYFSGTGLSANEATLTDMGECTIMCPLMRDYWGNHHKTKHNHDDVIKWKDFRVTGPLWGDATSHWWSPWQRPVTRNFDVFFDPRLNRRLSKQSRRRWFETPSRSLLRHCNDETVCIFYGIDSMKMVLIASE